MDLNQAQQHFLRDAKFRQQYDMHKDGVDLAMHLSAIRKERGMSHASLAAELGVSKYAISKIENLRGRAEPWVVSVVVKRFQNELRKRGIPVEKWLVVQPSSEAIPVTPGRNLEASGGQTLKLQMSKQARGNGVTIDRQRLKLHDKKESAA